MKRPSSGYSDLPFVSFQFAPSVDVQNFTPYVKKPDVFIRPDIDDLEFKGFDAVNFYIKISEPQVLAVLGAWNNDFANESDYRNASYLDKMIKPCANQIVDPPYDDHYCISPKYYPEFWEEAHTSAGLFEPIDR